MSDPDNGLRAYLALARGPGTIRQATEGTEALPDDVELEPDVTGSQELPAVELREFARDTVPGVASDRVPIDLLELDDSARLDELPPSPMFIRVLEELSAYVAPAAARKALATSLAQAGIHPDEATSLDIREAVVDVLPILLGKLLDDDDRETVLERLETALTEAIVPTKLNTTKPETTKPE
jgi:hypothetical protein